MKLIRNTFAAGLVAALSMAACSSQQVSPGTGIGSTTNPGSTPSGSAAGQVSMHLQIGQGINLQSLNYTVNGPNTKTGNIPIGDAQSIEEDIGGIPAGTGYTITLSGTDTANDPCTGTSTSFSVQPGLVTYTTITVTCTEPADASNAADVNTGVVAVDAGVNLITAVNYNCPGISSFSISPAEISSPQTAALTVATVQASGGSPGTETITWTASNGGFVDTGTTTSSLAAPTFSCGTFVGTATVSVLVGLTGSNNGVDAGNVCANEAFTTYSANIVCESGTAACFSTAPTLCGTTCTNTNTDNNNCGACGTVCAAPETCNGGSCSCASGTSLCGGACVALNTNTNCGACGTACTGATSCNAVGSTFQCTAPPATACTVGPCAANTITCPNNALGTTGSNAGVCTATEAVFVAIDIKNGLVTGNASGTVADNSSNSCLGCLNAGGCLDTSRLHTLECGDVSGATGSFTSANGVTTSTAAQACVNTLSCITGATGVDTTLGTNCASDPAGISYCSCGAAGFATNSSGNSGTIGCSQDSLSTLNGACETLELAGMTTESPGNFIANFTTTSIGPSGYANSILNCGSSTNSCPQCFTNF
jgi:hypothetical protein